jgi:hypothetical protein
VREGGGFDGFGRLLRPRREEIYIDGLEDGLLDSRAEEARCDRLLVVAWTRRWLLIFRRISSGITRGIVL